MATIKSFTDIEQSTKLAEILPIESADMWYSYYGNSTYNPTIAYNGEQLFLCQKRNSLHSDIPCWSLAALYSILPNNKKESTTLSRGGWKIEPIEYLDNWWCEYEDNESPTYFNTSADNPVDACYEMIIKLKELNLL